jgi:transcriptional regulator with XRE-family HTH domain
MSLKETPRSRSRASRASPRVRGRHCALSSGPRGAIIPGNVCPDLSQQYVMSRSHSQHKSDLLITGDDAAAIGARIRQIRGAASQREFADRLGISREQLSRIESGAQVPGTETLRRLAQLTRVPLDFVLFGGDAPLRAAAASGDWEAALTPLLGGTRLRLSRPSRTAAHRAERAWQRLADDRKEDIRVFVRRIALIGVALEALLPPRAARGVTDALSEELSMAVVDRILGER